MLALQNISPKTYHDKISYDSLFNPQMQVTISKTKRKRSSCSLFHVENTYTHRLNKLIFQKNALCANLRKISMKKNSRLCQWNRKRSIDLTSYRYILQIEPFVSSQTLEKQDSLPFSLRSCCNFIVLPAAIYRVPFTVI